MKKISLFVMAFVAALAVNAQNTQQLRTPREVTTRFGIKAGVNSASLNVKETTAGNQNNKVNAKTSLHAGVFLNAPLSSNFRIQPELLYSIQGAKTTAMSSSDLMLAGINELDLHYVSLPVMFQYMSDGGLSLELGPQFSYLSSANGDRNNGSQVNLKDGNYIKKTDVAVGGGVGYLTRIGLGVNARYVYGFTNVWNNKERPASTTGMNYQNRNLQFSLTYHFGAHK
jgi:hypothetical protein